MGQLNTKEILASVANSQPLWGPYVIHIAEKQVEPVCKLVIALDPNGATSDLATKAYGNLKHATRTHLGILGFTVDFVFGNKDFEAAVVSVMENTINELRASG